VESSRHPGITITAAAIETKRLAAKYGRFVAYTIDGASKQAVEEMKQIHAIPWRATKKGRDYKYDAIQRMNDGFREGTIKVLPHQNQALISEWKSLIWDPKRPQKEHASKPNDLCDAALYAFLESKHWITPHQTLTQPDDPSEAPRRYYPIVETDDDSTVFDYLDAYRGLTND